MSKSRIFVAMIACATVCAVAPTANAQSTSDLSQYYIGIDNNPFVTFGDFTDEPNPNVGRVTLLFNHDNLVNVEGSHYHPIGAYSYTGDVSNPIEVPTNTNNRLPEAYTGTSLELAAAPVGSPYEGMLISGMGAGSGDAEYGNLEIRENTTIPNTDGYGPLGQAGTTNLGNAAYYMYTRESQNFTLPMDNLALELELVAITPGLAVGDAAGNVLMDGVGDKAAIFASSGSFTPTFFAAANATPGVYSASFVLNDTSGNYDSSGTFHFDFTVIPEPSSLVLLSLAATAVCGIRRKQYQS